MTRKLTLMTLVLALGLIIAAPVLAGGGPPPKDADGKRVRSVIYVVSQGLYYDTIVGPGLPAHGPFQELFPPGANPDWPAGTTKSTMWGPGDRGYVGGRWSLSTPEGVVHFSCPLLGPGRASP